MQNDLITLLQKRVSELNQDKASRQDMVNAAQADIDFYNSEIDQINIQIAVIQDPNVSLAISTASGKLQGIPNQEVTP